MARLFRLINLIVLVVAAVQSSPPLVLLDNRSPEQLQGLLLVYGLVRLAVLIAGLAVVYYWRSTYRAEARSALDFLGQKHSPTVPTPRQRKLYRGLAFLLILVPAAALCRHLDGPIQGVNYFRQTHVAAQIESQVQRGVWTIPENYNKQMERRLFDFPLYQGIVAGMSRNLPIKPVVAGRIVSVLVFIAGALVFLALLNACGLRWEAKAAACGLVVASPLHLYYAGGVIPDPLVLLFSLLCLYGYARCADAGGWKVDRFYALMLIAGALSAFMKNPIMVPVAFAVTAHQFALFGWRGWFRPAFLGFAASLLAAVTGFVVLSWSVDGHTFFSFAWYFGDLAFRSDPQRYWVVWNVLLREVLNPATGLLAAFGLVLFLRDSSRPCRGIFLGWLVGAVLTVLVFFGVHRHNYYQLIFVYPLALFGGWGLVQALRMLWHGFADSPRLGRAVVWAALLFLAVFSVHESIRTLDHLNRDRTGHLRQAGRMLLENTGSQDFVIYLQDHHDWNPAYLYYAKREGYYLPLRGNVPHMIDRLSVNFARPHRSLFLFCPARLRTPCPGLPENSYTVQATGESGALYRLKKAGPTASNLP